MSDQVEPHEEQNDNAFNKLVSWVKKNTVLAGVIFTIFTTISVFIWENIKTPQEKNLENKIENVDVKVTRLASVFNSKDSAKSYRDGIKDMKINEIATEQVEIKQALKESTNQIMEQLRELNHAQKTRNINGIAKIEN